MKTTRQPELDPLQVEKAFRRAAALDSAEILDSFDTYLSNLMRLLPEFRRTREPALLGEIKLYLLAMQGMVERLERRGAPVEPSQIRPARQPRGGHY